MVEASASQTSTCTQVTGDVVNMQVLIHRTAVGLEIVHFPQTPGSHPGCWRDSHILSIKYLGSMVSCLGVPLMFGSTWIYLFQV